MSPLPPQTFRAKLWIYPSDAAAWYFVTVPRPIGDAIKATTKNTRRGFGSVSVTVTIGKSTFMTALFPDRHSQSFIMPVKATVRRQEELLPGDTISVTLLCTLPSAKKD